MALEARTLELDLPALTVAFSRRLEAAGVQVPPERSARLAEALALVKPITRRRLYWTARAVLVSDSAQVNGFNAAFAAVFGATAPRADEPELSEATDAVPAAPDERAPAERQGNVETAAGGGAAWSAPPAGRGPEPGERELLVPVAASDEERLRQKRFDALEPHELAHLYRLMAELRIATPLRRTRRATRARRGERIDLRRTLRESLRTGGDPIRLAHSRRRILRRRLVVLCDISGSMEPYARAYLQFLTCAAGGGENAEAFVFATRLTRLTRSLRTRSPERAIQRAAAAAPDWSSGTRIADALKAFNDRHGRRGMARGAVVVILSDGWERGAPEAVAREMARLRRLAYRIVWVNPRAGASGFAPRAGGMAAALPYCDALVSGHSLDALSEVVEAIASTRGAVAVGPAPVADEPEPEQEPWASATPVPGSSVAMPSGYGPSRGNTTPGWSR